MPSPDMSRALWRKSSYSGNNGGNCLEITSLDAATWRKSTRSGSNGGACVEITTLDRTAWRKSTRSGSNGGACVEITGTRRVIAVRDSKDPSGPHLDFTPRQWQSFVTDLKARTQHGGTSLPA